MAFDFTKNGNASIGSTEYWLASTSTSKTDQTDDCMMQAWLDFGAMAAGDQYQVRLVEKVAGNTQRDILVAILTGPQSGPWVSPSFIVGEGWELGVKKLAGTDRTIYWSIRKAT